MDGAMFFRNCIRGFACLAIALLAMANKPCYADDSYLMTFFPREGNTGGYSQNLYSGLDNNFFFDLNRAFLFREVDKGVTYNPVNSVVKPIFDRTGLTSELALWDVNNPQFYITSVYLDYAGTRYLNITFTKSDGYVNTDYEVIGNNQVYQSVAYPHFVSPIRSLNDWATRVYPITLRTFNGASYFEVPLNGSTSGYDYVTSFPSNNSGYYYSNHPSSTSFMLGSFSSDDFAFYSNGAGDSSLYTGFEHWLNSGREVFDMLISLDDYGYIVCVGNCRVCLSNSYNVNPFEYYVLFSYGYLYEWSDSIVISYLSDYTYRNQYGSLDHVSGEFVTLYSNKYFLTNARPTTTPMPTPTDIPPWRDGDLPTPTGYPSVTVAPLPTGIVTDYIPLLDIPSNENVLSNITGIIKEFNSIFTRKVFSLGSYTLQVMYYFSGWFKFIFIVPAGVFIAFLIGRLRKK